MFTFLIGRGTISRCENLADIQGLDTPTGSLVSGGYKRKGGNQDDFKRKESSYHG